MLKKGLQHITSIIISFLISKCSQQIALTKVNVLLDLKVANCITKRKNASEDFACIVQIREDTKKGIHVEDLKEVEVTSARDVMQQLLQVYSSLLSESIIIIFGCEFSGINSTKDRGQEAVDSF